MPDLDTPLLAAFLACVAVVGFAYAGYPLIVWLLARRFGRDPVPPPVETADLPSVSLLVVAHNEATVMDARIQNALALHYPPGKLEIVIASDGSTDATNDVVARYVDRGVRLLAFPENRGKAATLDAAIAHLTGDVVVLSDANTLMDRDAVRQLAAWFADPAVGVVCGKLVLTDAATGRNADGLYWRYETLLKRCEGRLGALLGCNGAIYAIRRSIFPPVPAGTIVDDFVIPLSARRATGCRLVYDEQAVAREETAPDVRAEFRRRARIGAGGFQSLARLWPLLSPVHGWVSFTFFAHKVLRWLSPFALVGMLLLNLLLLDLPGMGWILAGQLGFYALAVGATWLPPRPRALRVVRLTTLFAAMNLALLVGFVRWLTGSQGGAWKRTDRSPVPAGAP
jgi:cellulose synthase/poly-beta-1,6-N-acetylglucosamine synthase-like glycosyltransferase